MSDDWSGVERALRNSVVIDPKQMPCYAEGCKLVATLWLTDGRIACRYHYDRALVAPPE